MIPVIRYVFEEMDMDSLSVGNVKQVSAENQGDKPIAIDLKVSRPETVQNYQKCDYCGTSAMVPSGSCYICFNCGSTLGCS